MFARLDNRPPATHRHGDRGPGRPRQRIARKNRRVWAMGAPGRPTATETPAAAPAKRASRRPTAGTRTAEKGTALSSDTLRGRNQPTPKKAAPRKTAGKRATAA